MKSVNLLRILLKNPQNVFIDDVDQIDNVALLELVACNKTCLFTASTIPSFSHLVDKVFYLSLGKFYEYKSLEQMKKERVDLSACLFFDDLVKTSGKICLDESGYMLEIDGEKYKFAEKYLPSLEKLKMELYDECEVVFACESSQHVFHLLDEGKINMYDKLTQEKIF